MTKIYLGFLFGLIAALLSATCLDAAPVESSETFDEVTAGRVSLFLLILEYFLDMLNQVFKQLPDVYRAVLKDPQVLSIHSREMEGYLADFEICLTASDEFNKKSNKDTIQKVYNKCLAILEKFNDDDQKLSADAVVIEKSLRENGYIEIENIIKDNFKLFLRKLNNHYNEYISSLTRSQKRSEQSLIDWMEKLNAESNQEKQLKMFEEIFKETN